MTKNLILGLILASLAQIWVQKFFFVVLPLLNASHFCKLLLHAISRKITIQTQENGKKPHFWSDLVLLGPKLRLQFFPQNLTLSVTSYQGQLSSCTK